MDVAAPRDDAMNVPPKATFPRRVVTRFRYPLRTVKKPPVDWLALATGKNVAREEHRSGGRQRRSKVLQCA